MLYGAFIFPKNTKPSWLESGSTAKLAKLLGPWLLTMDITQATSLYR